MVRQPGGVQELLLELEEWRHGRWRLDFHQLLAAVRVVDEEIDDDVADGDAIGNQRNPELPFPVSDLVLGWRTTAQS